MHKIRFCLSSFHTMNDGIVNQFDGCCWLFNTEIMKRALQIMQCPLRHLVRF